MAGEQSINVLPDHVAKDPNAEVAIVFARLADGLSREDVAACLKQVNDLLVELQHPARNGTRAASITFGLGRRFFARFPDLDSNLPAGFRDTWDLHAPDLEVDLVIHVTLTQENVVPRLLNGLRNDRARVAWVHHERGARTLGDREVFGQRDGLRGVPRAQRNTTVFIHEDRQPDEPEWLAGGTYGAYIKIQQNMDAWANLDPATRERIIGRRDADGSRTDLQPGTNPHAEGPFADPSAPPTTSHVRKAGPRGDLHDQTLILRRGVPFTDTENGAVINGLHFLSYQATLSQLDVVLNDWMFNPDFPTPGAGADALLSMVTFVNSTAFVVPPHDDRFPGAGYFDPPKESTKRKSRIVVKKVVTDANGTQVRRERGGFEFTFIDKATGSPLGEPVRTSSAGRAVSPKIKVGTTVLVRETPQPDRFETVTDIETIVAASTTVVPVTNRTLPTAPNVYGSTA